MLRGVNTLYAAADRVRPLETKTFEEQRRLFRQIDEELIADKSNFWFVLVYPGLGQTQDLQICAVMYQRLLRAAACDLVGGQAEVTDVFGESVVRKKVGDSVHYWSARVRELKLCDRIEIVVR